MEIKRLYWTVHPAAECSWAPTGAGGRVLALLPGPVDHDACLGGQGFSDFADTSEAWDSELREIIEKLLVLGERSGPATLVAGDYPVRYRYVLGIPVLRQRSTSVAQALLCSALDDQFPPCAVAFGEPPALMLRTAGGHPFVWIWQAVPDATPDGLLQHIAGGRPLEGLRMDAQAFA
jgi:hypothetical protein